LSIVLNSVLDPWEKIHSEVTDVIVSNTAPYLSVVSDYYGTPKANYCMVLGFNTTYRDIICAHIWPLHTRGLELSTMGLSVSDIDNPRNFLRLHRSIEKAFDQKKLYFYVSSRNEEAKTFALSVCITDPNLKTEKFSVGQVERSFSDLHLKEFDYEFTLSKKPFLRLLAMHAQRTLEKALNLGWIGNDNFAAERERVLELARYSLDASNTETMFPSF
jgi:hypothetical protein